jgi:hypothetical protein
MQYTKCLIYLCMIRIHHMLKKKYYSSNYISCIDILFICKKIFDIDLYRFAQGMAKATKY